MNSLNEKLAIIDDPDKNLLNERSEVISQCRQRNNFKLGKPHVTQNTK